MARYIINKQAQPNGDHEVHIESSCIRLPLPQNRYGLGDHSNCASAVAAGKKIYITADGCYWCLPACHKS